jgi:hypothetical protein
MPNPNLKIAITKAVLKQLPETQQSELDWAQKAWWVNKRKTGGLRLTDIGDFSFRLAEIEMFNFSFIAKKHLDDDLNWNKFMLDLNYKLPCPYYIDSSKNKEPILRVYDSKVAMLISLYGNIYEYINQTTKKTTK